MRVYFCVMNTINRRTLLYAFGLASVSPLLPAQTSAKGKVCVAKPGENRFAFASATQAKLSPCKLTSEDSGGTLSTFELSALPQSGPMRHVHHREDEWYYVLSGEFLFKAGDETHTLPVGGSIWLPRDIPHVWANLSAEEAKVILVCQPGGFEKFFDELGQAMEGTHADDPSVAAKMKEVMAKYGIEMLGPPLFKPLRH
jgi:quercetin dioxygenase-like cupin family protein